MKLSVLALSRPFVIQLHSAVLRTDYDDSRIWADGAIPALSTFFKTETEDFTKESPKGISKIDVSTWRHLTIAISREKL